MGTDMGEGQLALSPRGNLDLLIVHDHRLDLTSN